MVTMMMILLWNRHNKMYYKVHFDIKQTIKTDIKTLTKKLLFDYDFFFIYLFYCSIYLEVVCYKQLYDPYSLWRDRFYLTA